MIYPVAVRSNEMKPLNSTLALGFYFRVLTEGRAKWLFLCPHTTAPLAILSAHVCGSEGGKRITLTETFRGSKGNGCTRVLPQVINRQIVGDDIDCRRDRFSGLINKAADSIKGRTPILTPAWVLYRILISIIPIRCPFYCRKESKVKVRMIRRRHNLSKLFREYSA